MDIEKQLELGASVDIPLALQSLRPGAEWVLRGDQWSGLEWVDKVQSQPTQIEVEEEIERLNLLKENLQYRRARSEEYRSIEEQLDLLYWDGVNGTTNWSDHITTVKENHPKP